MAGYRNIFLACLLVISPFCLFSTTFAQDEPSPERRTSPVAQVDKEADSQLLALLPGDALPAGWTVSKEPEFYDASNLWEPIDGEAEAYLAYDFQRLATVEYQSPESSPVYYEVNVNKMSSPETAYGVYSSFRSRDSKLCSVGAEGFATANTVSFYKGPYYVHVVATASGAEDHLMKLARSVADKVKDESRQPTVLRLLPRDNGYANQSERYVLKNFLSQSFLANGAEAYYKLGGEKESRLFVAELSSEDNAKNSFAKFKQYLAAGEILKNDVALGDQGVAAKESFYGIVVACRKGRYVLGLLDSPDEATASKLIEQVVKAISSETTKITKDTKK